MLEFENFSSRARRSINRFQAESHWLGHNFVGSEQFLLGILGADEALKPVPAVLLLVLTLGVSLTGIATSRRSLMLMR